MHQNCFSHKAIIRLIKLVHALENTAEKNIFTPHNLTMSTGKILMILSRINKATPSELIKATDCSKSNLSQRLITLKKAGLIIHEKPQPDSDQRHNFITLTEKGRNQAHALLKIFEWKIAEFENSIPQKDWEHIINILEIINKKIESSSRITK
ncbi:winged helix-turn-helix transcriptional regulator [Candidatus Uhrbacteria bacterium]|nr:winged helix-turn-helix transcriptional regulator [Candidatus Uhrbacteria bacterium]